MQSVRSLGIFMQVSLQINSDKKHALIGHFQVALNLTMKVRLRAKFLYL